MRTREQYAWRYGMSKGAHNAEDLDKSGKKPEWSMNSYEVHKMEDRGVVLTFGPWAGR